MECSSTVTGERKDLFLSYGREEKVKDFVSQLKKDLETTGLSVWLDINDIPPGREWPKEVGIALRDCKALIAVITKKYVSSRFCKGELYVACSKGKRIYPVIYEDGWDVSDDGVGVNYMVAAENWAMFRPGVDDYDSSLKKLTEALKETAPQNVARKREAEEREISEDRSVKIPKLEQAENSGHPHNPSATSDADSIESSPPKSPLSDLSDREDTLASTARSGVQRGYLDAVKRGNLKKVKDFHRLGAQLCLCDSEGWTPLIHAARLGRKEVVQYLVDNMTIEEIDMVENKMKQTALHKAAWYGFRSICKMLVEKGASLTLVDHQGNTPYTQAVMSEDESLQRYLKRKETERKQKAP